MEVISSVLASLGPPQSRASGKPGVLLASKGEPGSSREATRPWRYEDETLQETWLGGLGCYLGRSKPGLMGPEGI